MSIDRGQTPSSGATQDDSDLRNTVVVPSPDLLARILEMQGLKYIALESGPVVLLYEQLEMYVEFVGKAENNEEQIVSLRLDYHRRYRREHATDILWIVNTWNQQNRWPRLAVDRNDDAVSVTGDAHMPVGSGVGLMHFLETLRTWMQWAMVADEYLGSAVDDSMEA
ncbi:YbjN domain-containing protein [Nocardia sp. NPDC048505]|uniref:YbjN domain-containing protein n=1 Tax=unclassified Nocardia TaxID=2637762 RepID=UPI003405C0CF